MMAATFAGMGFGNAGVHIPHANAYPIAGMVQRLPPRGLPADEPMVPHGQSVSLTAPEAFRFSFESAPERHLRAAALLARLPVGGSGRAATVGPRGPHARHRHPQRHRGCRLRGGRRPRLVGHDEAAAAARLVSPTEVGPTSWPASCGTPWTTGRRSDAGERLRAALDGRLDGALLTDDAARALSTMDASNYRRAPRRCGRAARTPRTWPPRSPSAARTAAAGHAARRRHLDRGPGRPAGRGAGLLPRTNAVLADRPRRAHGPGAARRGPRPPPRRRRPARPAFGPDPRRPAAARSAA